MPLQTCFIRVEVKKRELISRIDLAIEMVKRGVPVILGECYDSKEILDLGIDRGYFFGKCAQHITLDKYKSLLDHGWTFGALDEEGLLPDSLESFALKRFSSESAKIYSDIFFFGKEQKEIFEKTYGIRNSYIVSGNPRIDMWKNSSYGIFDQSIKEIKIKYKNFALIPNNFYPYTMNAFQSIKKEDDLDSSFKARSDRSEFLFDNFCKLAENLAHDKNINVIFRPHPADDPKTLRSLMFKHGVKSKKVHCISSYDALPWISAAKILFHNCCATSLEAGFIGTPVITYAPSNTSLYQDNKINNFFPIATSYEDVLSHLAKVENNNSSDFLDKINNWGRLSLKYLGKSSSFIADKISQRNKFESFNDRQLKKPRFDFKRFKYEVISEISSKIGNNQRKVYLEKFPRTEVEEIRNIVDHICRFKGYSEQPEIDIINSRLFHIFPKQV